MIKIFLLIFAITLALTGCAFFEDTNAVDLVSTHPVEAEIMPVEQARELALRKIIKGGDALPDSHIMTEQPHLVDVDWGPVVFVENKDTKDVFRFCYIFYGQMPDSGLAVAKSIDAETGKFLAGGIIPYSETNKKVFVLTPGEAREYAARQLLLDPDGFEARAVYYPDFNMRMYTPCRSWRYELRRKNGDTIRAAGKDLPAIYVLPFTVGYSKEDPFVDDAGAPVRSRILAMDEYETEAYSEKARSMQPATRKRYVALDL